MAFPTTPVLDDANRADGYAGSAWSIIQHNVSTKNLHITNNQFDGPDFNNASYWNAGTAGPDSEAYATYRANNGTADQRVYARISSPSGSPSGYSLDYNTSFKLTLNRWDSGIESNLTFPFVPTLAAGDKWGLEIIGSTLTGYAFQSGAWSSQTTTSDSTYSAAGYIGAFSPGTGYAFDDFGGGTVSTGPAPYVKSGSGVIG